MVARSPRVLPVHASPTAHLCMPAVPCHFFSFCCAILFLFRLLAKASSSERKDFVNEIDMMKKVAKGSNPHVVSLIGCVTVEEPLCLIIEYLKYGDLLSYLHGIKQEVSSTMMHLQGYMDFLMMSFHAISS